MTNAPMMMLATARRFLTLVTIESYHEFLVESTNRSDFWSKFWSIRKTGWLFTYRPPGVSPSLGEGLPEDQNEIENHGKDGEPADAREKGSHFWHQHFAEWSISDSAVSPTSMMAQNSSTCDSGM